MKYFNIKEGTFIERLNRFIAHIDIDGKIEICHVKNTGRCKEILIEGSRVFVQEFDSKIRKTKFDLISVYKGERLINIDSQVPNKMFSEWINLGNLFNNVKVFKSEVFYRNSRFDFYVEYENKKAFIEVKGATLEREGIVLFPDAPTSRGVKHLNELIKAKQDGYDAYIVFIVQMDNVKYFVPNYDTHKEFGDMLSICKKSGVNIFAFDSMVLRDEIYIKDNIDVLI